MQTENVSEVVSKPEYPLVTLNRNSGYHCFISEGAATSEMSELYAECDQHKCNHELTEVEPDAVMEILKEFPLNGTLYLAGSEPFIWKVAEIGRGIGIRADQIAMFEPAVKARNLFCCHCYEITEGATYAPYTCSGCGRLLAVTDHFAKAHAAYFCYQVNAEDSTDNPEAEEFCA